MDYRELKKAVILDFDGTLALLFVNYDLKKTAHRLQTVMGQKKVAFSEMQDAFDVFGEVLRQTPDGAARQAALDAAEREIALAEWQAAEVCESVADAARFLRLLNREQIPFAVATNNSAASVQRFLQRIVPELARQIPIVGRNRKHPELMKPNPWSILEACRLLEVIPENAVLIGDTANDFHGAARAGCAFLGLTVTEKKRNRLAQCAPQTCQAGSYSEITKELKQAGVLPQTAAL